MPKNQIQKLKDEIKKLRELAYKDELTNLYNRRGFKEEAQKFIEEVIGYRKNPTRRQSVLIKNFSLIIFDIDNFKKLNDTYGHQAGDQALKLVGQLLLERARDWRDGEEKKSSSDWWELMKMTLLKSPATSEKKWRR